MPPLNATEILSIFLLACTGVGVQMSVGDDTNPDAYAGRARFATDIRMTAGAPLGNDINVNALVSTSGTSGARTTGNANSTASLLAAQAHARQQPADPEVHTTTPPATRLVRAQ